MEFLEITPYRVAVPLVALFFMVYAWNHVIRGSKTLWEAGLWTIFWGGVTVIALFPSWVGFIASWTGFKDQENAVFAIMIGILFFMVFLIIIKLEKMQKRITDVVRGRALDDAGLKEDSKSE
jgi:hypothetical protein